MTTISPDLICPVNNCDRTLFRQVVTGRYVATEYLSTDLGPIDRFDEQDIETTMLESFGWECADGHPTPDELADRLDALRNE